VPAVVHLPEPVLRLHVALRQEQVARVVGVDLRHAVPVAQHLDLAREAVDRKGAGGLRQWAAYDEGAGERRDHADHEQDREPVDRGPERSRPVPEPVPALGR